MLRKKQKGQSLVEFALVLPILLLLLLGVIEAARVVWAYITVQAAAREAARYAITGRPNVITSSPAVCIKPENLPNGEPWICPPEARAEAIKEIARGRARTLAVEQFCDDDAADYSGPCSTVPGAFGIAVVGQYVNSNVDPVKVEIKDNYAGDQGLNVSVHTYYNIQMFDPIFDTIMGGNAIKVHGKIQMQNEGLDQSLGFPPPPIEQTSGPGLPTGPGLNKPTITAQNGPTIELNANLTSLLQKHPQDSTYDIILKSVGTLTDYTICTAVAGDLISPKTYDCKVDAALGLIEGDYILYSKKTGGSCTAVYGNNTDCSLDPAAITQFVNVIAGITPRIEIAGGNVWAARSTVTINLFNHDALAETFDIYYQVGSDAPQAIPSLAGLTASPGPQLWKIPTSISGCPQNGGTTCTLFSSRSVDNPPVKYAQTTFFVNQPKITLSQGVTTYPQGALMQAFLEGHTPNHTYDVRIEGTGVNEVLDTVTTDSFGQFSVIEKVIPALPLPPPWPDGIYQLRSYEPGDTSNVIGEESITISTPSGPFITVDGGYTWPIDSSINIRVHKHPQAQNPYYLKFGPNFVEASPGVNTFSTDGSETAVVGYHIPVDITTVQQTFTVASFRNADNTQMATRDVTVVPVPLIQVLEGKTVLPNSEITIRLSNHSPNSSYKIYFGKEISDDNSVGKLLLTMVTDGGGMAERTYDLTTLPADPPPNFAKPDTCQCYGKAYHMYSQALNNDQVAKTELTIDSADLAITKIEVPPSAKINTMVPVTLTIQNLKPVTINRYFDIDLYLNPSPLVPAYSAGRFNFPGDIKYWKNFVAPNGQPGDTFTIKHEEFFVGQYGDQDLYGYADTTNVIVFENNETNNIGQATVPVACLPNVVTSGFTWAQQNYGAGVNGSNSQGSTIQLTSKGSGTTGPDDNAKGHYLLYLDKPITTTMGFEVVTRITQAPQTANFAKAGIQLRNAVNNGESMKIEFDLAWNNTGSPPANKQRVQVALRTDNGADLLNWKSSQQVTLATPVWLRVVREGGSNTFNFYYVRQSAKPTDWGNPYSTASVAMDAQLYVGLFNASGSNANATSKFDNFSYTDGSNCVAGIGQPAENIPPGLTLCTDLLEETSFETAPPQKWHPGNGAFIGQSEAKANSGLRRLVAPTLGSGFHQPFFYQEFTMPTFVYSATTGFNLTLNRNIDAQVADDPADQFYAVIATTPSPATRITTPTLVAEGLDTNGKWTFLNTNLIPAAGTNLKNYAGQKLNLYLYNNSNASCIPNTGVGCHKTTYDFDDMQLVSCTTQPPPATVNTILRGTVTLHRLSAGSEKLHGVKVWAYAEDGELYETFTAQDGSYTFYNMPADNYVIYSEYHFINPVDPTQIETLATNTKVTLGVQHNASNPLVVNLDLYTVFP